MLQYKVKNTFPIVIIIFGFLFIFCGFILMLGGSFVGIPMVVMGAIFSFTMEGVTFDLENKRFKEFTGFLGIKSGKWKSNENYPYASLLNFNVQSSILSLSNQQSTDTKMVYRLYMLNHSHFDKILIKEFKTEDKAKEFAKQFIKETNLQLVSYAPQISSGSRSRKR